jgi:type II secretory pathway pseudopilin PulG
MLQLVIQTSQWRESRAARRAMTLVELLVVIVIVMILTAVAIPVMAPNVEQKRIREAARLLSSYITGARARAMEIGRPVGIQFQRLPSNPNSSMTLKYVEVQQPFAGDYFNSTIQVSFSSSTTPVGGTIERFPSGDSTWLGLIKPGDLIQFDHKGNWYRVFAGEPFRDLNYNGTWDSGEPFLELSGDMTPTYTPAPNGVVDPDTKFFAQGPQLSPSVNWTFVLEESWNSIRPVPFATTPSFQIVRQPVTAAGSTLQIPDGAVVDLSLSGGGSGADFFGFDASINFPFVVMFSPDGTISNMYFGGVEFPAASRPLHLFIGRADGVAPSSSTDTDRPLKLPKYPESLTFDNSKSVWNIRDLNNLWVSINAQTGTVSTTENASITDTKAAYSSMNFLDPSPDFPVSIAITEARRIARSFQSLGGR